MSHDKKHLAKATVLTKTRYIGFARSPVLDTSRVGISGLPEPTSGYELSKRPWVDCAQDRKTP